ADAFTFQIVGAQLELVDDRAADANGGRRGSSPSSEKVVVTFGASGMLYPGGHGSLNERAERGRLAGAREAKARRMLVYPMGLAAGPAVVMPFFMAELQLLGLDHEELRTLLRWRNHLLPQNPTTLRLEIDWSLQLEWAAPDRDYPGGNSSI